MCGNFIGLAFSTKDQIISISNCVAEYTEIIQCRNKFIGIYTTKDGGNQFYAKKVNMYFFNKNDKKIQVFVLPNDVTAASLTQPNFIGDGITVNGSISITSYNMYDEITI
jgi:hypothetical protein